MWPKFQASLSTSNTLRKVPFNVAHFAILCALCAKFSEGKVHLWPFLVSYKCLPSLHCVWGIINDSILISYNSKVKGHSSWFTTTGQGCWLYTEKWWSTTLLLGNKSVDGMDDPVRGGEHWSLCLHSAGCTVLILGEVTHASTKKWMIAKIFSQVATCTANHSVPCQQQ